MNKIEIAAVKIRNGLNKVFPHNKKHLYCSVILCAAGSSTRMGGVSKQLLPLAGTPCFLYSALAFDACPDVDEIVICAKDNEVDEVLRLCKEYSVSKLSLVTPGGSTRQESVRLGFEKISKKSEIVMIHDAARPLITSDDISSLYRSSLRHGAVCPAKPVTDTVKRVDPRGKIVETIPRDDLYLVQTPQVFKTDIYRVSLAFALRDNITVTDDCALVEHAGFPIQICEIFTPNLKITHPGDPEQIIRILEERKDG